MVSKRHPISDNYFILLANMKNNTNEKVKFIERTNGDHRQSKILHSFDGRGFPLDPEVLESHIRCFKRLSSSIDFDYVLGFAEAGLLPAYAFARLSKKHLVGSYRVRMRLPNEISFLEPHSRISRHFVYCLKDGDKVIIVEDEVTTGNTIVNAVNSLEQKGVRVSGIFSLILNDIIDSNVKVLESKQIPFYYIYRIDSQGGLIPNKNII